MSRPASSSQRRRFIPLVLVGVAVAIILIFSRHAPVDVDARYRLADRSQVVELRVAWEGEDGKSIDASFNYRGDRVPRTQDHRLELPPDTYQVTLTTVRDDGTVKRRQHEVEVEEATTIELEAPSGP